MAMNFDLTDDQKLLVESVQKFCREESPVERLRKMRDNPIGWEKSTWQKMGELGWLGVAFPEDVGGLGGSFQDLALIVEQLGTTLVPEPIIASIAVAGRALLEAGTESQKEELLSPTLAGEQSLALAYLERESRHDVTNVQTTATKAGSGYTITGQKRWVLNGQAADHILVSARTSGEARDRDGVSLFVVDPGMKGVSIKTIQCMDSHKAALLDLDGVEVGQDRRLGEAGKAADVLDLALDSGAATACAEGSGIVQSVLQMTRNYLCEREQFGAKIGTFQALQHRCVDMFVQTELVKSMAIMAMIKLDDTDADERRRAISACKAQLTTGGIFVCRQGIQLHGGIGVTDEHDVGLYFKRMHILNTLFGDEAFHAARYGALPSFTEGVERSSAY